VATQGAALRFRILQFAAALLSAVATQMLRGEGWGGLRLGMQKLANEVRFARSSREILPDESFGKIRGIFAVFAARGTASLSLVAEQ
jgi:hypothetical protein